MKKFIAIALVVLTVFSFSTVAFAADTTTLTTTVPDAAYTLNIPADQEIAFGATSTDIGNVTVTNSSGFAEGKDLHVTVTYGDFHAEGISTTIPYYINAYGSVPYNGQPDMSRVIQSGNYLVYKGTSDGKCKEYYYLDGADIGHNYEAEDATKILQVKIDSTDWGKALGGEYTSTITFTAEVVSES